MIIHFSGGFFGGNLGAMVMVNSWSLSQSQFMVMVSHSQNYEQYQRQNFFLSKVKCKIYKVWLVGWVVMAGR